MPAASPKTVFPSQKERSRRIVTVAMSDLEAIQNVLARAARRRRLQRAWHGFWHGLLSGAVLWLIALVTYKLAPIPFSILIGAGFLALLCLAAGFLRGWLHRPTLLQTARCVDDRQHLQE